MLKIENTEVHGWDAAIRGMRNPMNSWDRSDSYWTYIEDAETHHRAKFEFFMGENDLNLMKNLAQAGDDHGKVLRYIDVTMDVDAPLYWWKEADTYRVAVAPHPTDVEYNSCSTMHKIHAKDFELDDFSHEHMREMSMNVLKDTIRVLNIYRRKYLDTKDKIYWWQLIQDLPSTYNQRRTMKLNYAVLRNIYHARRHHKLDEWHVFCDWIESLPYSEVITA